MTVTLQRSRLALMGDDVDLTNLHLFLKGTAGFDATESMLDVQIDRTIEGASTVAATVVDRDKKLLRSGLLGNERNGKMYTNLDVRLDGLWFRMVKGVKQGNQATLTFEDREVALLRSYPKPDAPHNGFILQRAKPAFQDGITRVEFARDRVKDVKEIPGGIEFVCPELRRMEKQWSAQSAKTLRDLQDQATRDSNRDFGFPPNAASYLTVKGDHPSPQQLDNLDAVLKTGADMLVARKLEVCAVMCVIQESSAQTSATNGTHVGLFQQDPRYWPATGDPVTDSRACFEAIIKANANYPGLGYADLIERVQGSGENPEATYGRWRDEAEAIVSAWGMPFEGAANDPHAPSAGPPVGIEGPLTRVEVPLPRNAPGQWTRGSTSTVNRKTVWKREDDWACLQRLAQEIQWRCYCSAGKVYFGSDSDWFKSKPIASVTEGQDGVDWIDGDYDLGKRGITLTVTCRIGRWQVGPGEVVVIHDMGPTFDGRWLVASVSRSAFSTAGTVTLVKPTPQLPEDRSPEFVHKGGTKPLSQPGGLPPPSLADVSDVRKQIVEVARKALAQGGYHYAQRRPIPAGLFSAEAKAGIDCSAFTTLVYKTAGAPDPNGNGYNGSGNTGTQVANGARVQTPQPGDLVMYSGAAFGEAGGWSYPGHVAIFVGDGQVIEQGGGVGPKQLPVSYRNDLLGYVDTLGDLAGPPGAQGPIR